MVRIFIFHEGISLNPPKKKWYGSIDPHVGYRNPYSFHAKKIDASPGFIKITMSHESHGFTVAGPLGRWAFPISLLVVESAAASARPLPQSVPRWRCVYPWDQIRLDQMIWIYI